LVQRKSKDAELAKPVFAELHQVSIPNWYDEDGMPVTSAVVIASDTPAQKPKKESKIDAHRKLFENAWWGSDAEERDGKPYLSRSALKAKLESDGVKERTIRNMINPSYQDKLIGALLQSEIICTHENGWIVIDNLQSSAMILRKNCG